MCEWLRDALFASALLAVVVLTIITYAEHRKPDPPAPVITVVETTDPDMLTAKWIIGTQQIEIQNLVHLYENQSEMFGQAVDRLVEEMRKEMGP